jgi:FdhD protein
MRTKQDIPVIRVDGKSSEGVIDEVATEVPVSLVLNKRPIVTLLCTPSELEELAVGFLVTEGLLRDLASLKKVEWNERTAEIRVDIDNLDVDSDSLFEKRTIASGCGKGITFTKAPLRPEDRVTAQGPMLSLENIRSLLHAFRNISALYLETGGVHSAALAVADGIVFFSEDIGRHNAVDKLLGKAFLRSIPLADKILLTSGRVTSEIVMKAARHRLPVLISRAAPSCMAIGTAEDMGITLVGFARGERMNIYARPDRIGLS